MKLLKFFLIFTIFNLVQVTKIMAQQQQQQPKSNNLFCGIKNAKKLYDVIDQLDNDKQKHCTMSCILQMRCNQVVVFYTGFFKEIADIFTDGSPEIQDMKANIQGISIALNVAKDEKQCFELCSNIY